MPKVSVIMPSLNVADYIDECLKSVVGQTLKDIEIIAVDAGSTDGTFEIIKSYSENDNRVRVINADKKSYGYQMNLGLQAATGEYVGIVETDDMIEPTAYEELIEYADKYRLDYVKGYGHVFYDVGGRYSVPTSKLFFNYTDVINPSTLPELLCKDIFLWLGVYRRDFVKNVRFNETSGAAYQDQGFLLQTIGKAKRAMYVDAPIYYYRQSNPSASQLDVNGFKYIEREYELNEKYLDAMTDDWRKIFYSRLFGQVIGRFAMMGLMGAVWASAKDYIELLREKLSKAYENKLIDCNALGDMNTLMLHLFLQSPDKLYEYFYEKYSREKKGALDIIKWANDNPVVIWGAGKWGKFIQALLFLNGVKVVAFADGNSDLWGSRLQGIGVISPDVAKKKYANAHFLIAAKNYNEQIRQELESWGIDPDRIYYREIVVDNILLSRKIV